MKNIYTKRGAGRPLIKQGFIGFLILLSIFFNVLELSAQIVSGSVKSDSLRNTSAVSISYANAGGTDQLMLVGISAISVTDSISSVVYNGAAFTKLGMYTHSTSGRVELWYLLNPSVGTFNVDVTSTAVDDAVIGVTTFIGVDQSVPFSNSNFAEGNSTSASTTITSTSNDLVYSIINFVNNDNNLTLGSGQNELWNFGVNSTVVGAGTTKTGSASVTVSGTSSQISDWSIGAVSINQNCTGSVGTPSFSLGASSTRCQGAGAVTYTATASNSSGISYALDASSLLAGNSINTSTGEVTFLTSFSGNSVITATATGCGGPTSATHTVTTNATVTTPIFVAGATSSRCQGTGNVTYTATANNATGISYDLDASSLIAGNTINSSTGQVSFVAGFSGNSVITVTVTGCGGPKSATHNVTTNASVTSPVFVAGATSSRCQGSGDVTYNATASNATGITYDLDGTSLSAGNTINTSSGAVTFTAGWTGVSTITASAAGCNGPLTSTHTVTTTASVTTPVFDLGASSSRCIGSETITYTATSSNAAGISYALDGTSLAAGNAISSSSGAVTFTAGWSGVSTITVTATGCNGPLSSTHTVTTLESVTTPIFVSGANSARCQGSETITYTATASNATGISYALDGTSLSAGNTINTGTGDVTFLAGWSGVSTITATAAGCNGPQSSTHTVTTNATVATPVFAAGASSTRCQGGGNVTYTATANNSTGITYALDGTSISAGNSINTATGEVTFLAGYSGNSVITATATGCNGPESATHSVTTNGSVQSPVFALGISSSRCQGSESISYSATATNATGISYSLDGASLSAGNTINASSGAVSYTAGWSGISTITATASGCNGPLSESHEVTTVASVTTPVFDSGVSSTRCQGAEIITYSATASNATSLLYYLDATSTSAGNSININTGAVTYVAGFAGNSIITATASGCNGPQSTTHAVTTIASVQPPVFDLGASSDRCQGNGNVNYTATAANSSSLTYSLDNVSLLAGNTINSSTGRVNYTPAWSGSSIITATAEGCNGPVSTDHTANTSTHHNTCFFSGHFIH